MKKSKSKRKAGTKRYRRKREKSRILVPAWNSLYPRTARSASPTTKMVRKVVPSERRGFRSGKKGKEDVRKSAEPWQGCGEMMTRKGFGARKRKFKVMSRFQNIDEGVLQTMVRDVVQEGEGALKRKRFAFRAQNASFPCVAAAPKMELLRSSHVKQNQRRKRRRVGESPTKWEK